MSEEKQENQDLTPEQREALLKKMSRYAQEQAAQLKPRLEYQRMKAEYAKQVYREFLYMKKLGELNPPPQEEKKDGEVHKG